MLSKFSNLLKSKAAKQGLVVLFDQGLMSLLTFVVGVLLARSSNENEYALYMLGWTIIFSMKGIQEGIVNIPLTIYSPRLNGNAVIIYHGNSLFITMVFTLICSLLMLFLYAMNKDQITGDYYDIVELAPYLALLFISFSVKDFLRNQLLSSLKIWESVRVNAVTSFVLLLIVCLLFYNEFITPIGTYILFTVAFLTSSVTMYLQNRKNYLFDYRLLVPHLAENWKIGKWSVIGNFTYMGSRQSFPWLILYFLNYESVAVYYACQALALAPAPLLRGAGAYIFPRMSHGYKNKDKDNLIRLLQKSILILCMPYIGWLIIGILTSNYLLNVVYGDKFTDQGLIFILLLISGTIDFVAAPLTNALQTIERTKDIAISMFIGTIVTLSTGPYLISELSLIGAGIASILSMIATIGWRIFALRSHI